MDESSKGSSLKIIISIIVVFILFITALVYTYFNQDLFKPKEIREVEAKVQEYLNENYGGEDYYIKETDTFSNVLKITGLYTSALDSTFDSTFLSQIKSKSSEDRYFTVNVVDGEINDNYEEFITNKYTTYQRISSEYSDFVKERIKNCDFNGKMYYMFSMFNVYEGQDIDEIKGEVLDTRKLELDKEYDVNKLGALYGSIYLEMEVDDFDEENMKSIFIDVKNLLDSKDVNVAQIEIDFINDSDTKVVRADYNDINSEWYIKEENYVFEEE